MTLAADFPLFQIVLRLRTLSSPYLYPELQKITMPASTSTSEADIIFNRANVALAKSQRLIASWLPPRTEEELRTAKSPEEIEREEAELFAPIPELFALLIYPPISSKYLTNLTSCKPRTRRSVTEGCQGGGCEAAGTELE